ncbi:hypothetical protein SEVIR_1G304050v4 [Setaria viridis]
MIIFRGTTLIYIVRMAWAVLPPFPPRTLLFGTPAPGRSSSFCSLSLLGGVIAVVGEGGPGVQLPRAGDPWCNSSRSLVCSTSQPRVHEESGAGPRSKPPSQFHHTGRVFSERSHLNNGAQS